jgi:nucleoid-associated protein YgaU
VQDGAGKIAGGLVLLVALWIGVYWWWPSEPKITFAAPEAPAQLPEGREPSKAQPNPPLKAQPKVQPKTASPPRQQPAPEPVAPRVAPRPEEPSPIAVVPPEFTDHTIQKNETFATISKKYFNTTAYADAISHANPFMDPTKLTPGRVVRVPKDPKNVQGMPAAPQAIASTNEYVVEPGDSLSKIAQELYGDSSLAGHIFQANRDQLKSEHALKIGQRLRIPPKP